MITDVLEQLAKPQRFVMLPRVNYQEVIFFLVIEGVEYKVFVKRSSSHYVIQIEKENGTLKLADTVSMLKVEALNRARVKELEDLE